jgi:hypothetical protein
VNLSKIFRWYEGDFGGKEGIIKFLIRHLPADHRREYITLNRSKLRLKYTPYDWRLNAS